MIGGIFIALGLVVVAATAGPVGVLALVVAGVILWRLG